MKIVTTFICATVALTILSACEKKALLVCDTPTLTPSSGSGPTNQDIKVTIETKTVGASLKWTDYPPTSDWRIIQGPKGDAITVYGRTLRAIAFKPGMTDSPPAQGTYVGQ